jgi:tRNA (cytidine56-2'-O)-methyltransferase
MITVLRLGHRAGRDVRITTHCALVSRALGAGECAIAGDACEEIVDSVAKVVAAWGGNFAARSEKNWRKYLRNFKGVKVHLTMYGMPVQEKIAAVRKAARGHDLLVVIGAEHVPGEVYGECDYNIAVTNQPHSEVAALAIFLHELGVGKELDAKFAGARVKITPSERGKNIEKK